MQTLRGAISQVGVGEMKKRMVRYPSVFKAAIGEDLYPGTLNIHVGQAVPPREHFKILGKEIEEAHQDLWFEICRFQGLWVFRIRPYRLRDGGGGHGDDMIEIASAVPLRKTFGIDVGSEVEVTFFR